MDVPLPHRAVSTLLFGKMPAHGDFVARGFDQDEREELDSWLTAEISRARDLYGERFNSLYERAPPWFFVIHQGARWISGALAPSIDNAGRRFPLLVAREASSLATATAMCAGCLEGIYDALQQSWSADQLAEWVPPTTDAGDPPLSPPVWWTEGNIEFCARDLAGERPFGLIVAMLQQNEVLP